MHRMKIKDIVEQDVRDLVADGYRPSVYRAKDGTVVEVSFVKRIGPEPWRVHGCSYMTDQWTPSALAKIAALAGATPRQPLPRPNTTYRGRGPMTGAGNNRKEST